MKYLMKCGHVANSVTADGKPFCVICGCENVAIKTYELEGRKARCSYCGKTVESNLNLPFFEFRPDKEYDSYYCGCGGWD